MPKNDKMEAVYAANRESAPDWARPLMLDDGNGNVPKLPKYENESVQMARDVISFIGPSMGLSSGLRQAGMGLNRRIGLGLGGSLDNCVIIDNNEVINAEGLRLENEFVVHKLLDAVGDIFTSGYRIQGEYKGYLCGCLLYTSDAADD